MGFGGQPDDCSSICTGTAKITGVVNPGDENATVKAVTFDYSNPSAWKVKLTAEGKDKSGKPVAISVDGTLEVSAPTASCFMAPGRKRARRASLRSRVISRR